MVPGIPRHNACLPERSRPEHSETSVFATTFAASLHHVTTFESGRHTTCRCGILSFWFSGEVKHIVHLIRWNLTAVFMPLWLTGTRACCGTIARPLGLGTESCYLTNCFGFFVCHQLVPHLVPNFPRVPLRNVSWGLGVCAVLVRSVSPCRFVPEVRLFPSPPCAVFGRLPVVCPLFSSSCLSGLSRLWPGVCVCNI